MLCDYWCGLRLHHQRHRHTPAVIVPIRFLLHDDVGHPDHRQTHNLKARRDEHIYHGSGVGHRIGDNGKLVLSLTGFASIQTTDSTSTTGGNDIIEGNEGDDIILGGVGGDTVNGGAANDIVLGDNGVVLTVIYGSNTLSSIAQISS